MPEIKNDGMQIAELQAKQQSSPTEHAQEQKRIELNQLDVVQGQQQVEKEKQTGDMLAQSAAFQQMLMEMQAKQLNAQGQNVQVDVGAQMSDGQKQAGNLAAKILMEELAKPGSMKQSIETSAGQLGGGNIFDQGDNSESMIATFAQNKVYSDLRDIGQKMSTSNQDKKKIGDIVQMYNTLLAKKWEGTKKVPQYDVSMDEKTGQVKITYKGTKEMTYDEAVAQKEGANSVRDSIGDFSQLNFFMLQRASSEKDQFESMISNILKSMREVSGNMVSNIK